jgi:hypothetical protein
VEFKASHPDEKGVSAVRSAHPHIFNWFWVVGCVVTGGALQVGKAGGEKWRSMTEEEKKPYIDQAKELKAKFDSGEGSAVISGSGTKSNYQCAIHVRQPDFILCFVSDNAGERCRG